MPDALSTFLHNAEGLGSTSFFFFLLVLFIGMGFWSGSTRMRLSPVLAGPAIDRIFFGLHVTMVDPQPGDKVEFFGHIVAINTTFVTLITPNFLPKGSSLQLNLGDLPGFPDTVTPYAVKVGQSRIQRGDPPSYRTTAIFTERSRSHRAPLATFLHQLARERRLYPAWR